MIFDIFMYILGTLLALNGYRLLHKGETLYSQMTQMTQMEMLTVISKRIIGSVHMCAGMIIIIIMAKG